MKFKNYTNPLTKDNRIYSDKDIFNLKVEDVFKMAKEILAQNKTIGM